MRYIEYLLAQEEILTKLSHEERSILQSARIRNMNERLEKYHEQLPLDAAFFLVVHISNMNDSVFAAYVQEHTKIQAFLVMGMMPRLDEEEAADFEAALNIEWVRINR